VAGVAGAEASSTGKQVTSAGGGGENGVVGPRPSEQLEEREENDGLHLSLPDPVS
jgi:hypothetical protein